MSAAGPPQGRPREQGEAETRSVRLRAWAEADTELRPMAVSCNEAEANKTPTGGGAADELENEAAFVGGHQ